MYREVSGPTVHFLLDDFLVRHDGPLRDGSLDERLYSWASRPGDWYKPEQWDDYTNVSTQQDPPGDWNKNPGKRRKYNQPKKWPDPKSNWLWFNGGAGYKWNDGDRKPKRRIHGNRFYRHNVKILRDSTRVRLFVTADEKVTVYVDGEEVIRKNGRETGYKTFARRDLILSRGMHTVAVHTRRSRPVQKGKTDGTDAFMFTMYDTKEDGTRNEVLLRSNGTWKCFYGGNPPGWRRAQVLRNCVFEARDRGNTTALKLGLSGFDGDVDSKGRNWGSDRFSQGVKIGTSALDLQAQLSEGNGFDVWVDPADLKIHAWKRRGKDVSKSVALMPGASLMDWSVEEIDETANDFLIKHDGGWAAVKAPGSVRDFGSREAYVELGGIKDDRTAVALMKKVIRGVGSAVQRAGSPDIVLRRQKSRDGSLIGIEGAYPFLDFNVGDVVSAPGSSGNLVKMRVMSLSCSEDDEGNLSFDPELEQI